MYLPGLCEQWEALHIERTLFNCRHGDGIDLEALIAVDGRIAGENYV